ncbi:NFACT family protein [Verrucomicrobia bacterium]|nr:NFACT family protein [Verrucomicrobiota bacterium]
MEYLLLTKIVEELQQELLPASVAKIYQPNADLLVFKLWNGRTSQRLLLSADSGKGRIHLTNRDRLNPDRPPRFCQLLRARVARIRAIELLNQDRILQLSCEGERGNCCLIVELIGAATNMILVDDNQTIIDCLKRDQRGRDLTAGASYCLPAKKLNQSEHKPLPVLADGQSWSEYVEQQQDMLAVIGQDFQTDLHKTVTKQLKKLRKRLQRLEQELESQQDADSYKQQGELLLANLHQLKRGMERIEVVDYYSTTGASRTIALDSALTPQENAGKYFKRYRKLSRGVDHCLRRFDETHAELEWLEQLEFQLSSELEKNDLEDIAEELRRSGLLKELPSLHRRRTTSAAKPSECVSPSGHRVIWGRNNRQNDEVSMRILKHGDLWYHAKDLPGSHVVLKACDDLPFTDEDRTFAASIAAGYSKARHAAKVEVSEADAKSISKPKGAKPGLVTLKSYKSLMVEPLRKD